MMTVAQLVTELQQIVDDGFGHARVIIEEVGEGYFGDLLHVDTLLVGESPTLTLLGEARDT